MKIKKDTVLTALLAVLVIVSAVQAVQLMSLNNALSSGGAPAKSVSKPAASGGSQPATQSTLPALPEMVGGC